MAFGIKQDNSTGPVRSWSGNWGRFGISSTAALTTALTGTNNDLTYTAKRGGAAPGLTVTYVVAGVSTPLSVVTTNKAVVVNVATNGSSAATSTAAQVAAAVAADFTANSLMSVANAPGNDGTGVVTAMSVATLTGGSDGVMATGPSSFTRVKAPL